MNQQQGREDHYFQRDSTATISEMTKRTASRHAAFFLPYLTSGMRVLDCGCGPGTISVGLAKHIAPGHVIGIDNGVEQVELARTHATQQGLQNIEFRVADIYALPFSDASFDAVFIHNVLEHLKEPLKALHEVRRVMVSHGVIGVRELDLDGILYWPPNPWVARMFELRKRLTPVLGKRLRSLLQETGFTRVIGSASYDYYGTAEDARWYYEFALARSREIKSTGMKMVFDLGFTEYELRHLQQALQECADHPSAFVASAEGEAIGWKE